MLCVSLLFGCATNPGAHPHDPWEPFNRSVSKFNDDVDAAVAKPVATAYKNYVPELLRTGVNNFFSNLEDPWTAINSAFQFKLQASAESVMRFSVNSFFGLGGLLDIASEMRIEKHKADFGHTLGYWGVAPGPYLVVPILGPSTLRDTLASTVIAKGDLVWQLDKVSRRNALYALRLLDQRANLLRNTAVLEAVALDKYTFTRDIFLQVRRNEVFDGNPPDDASKESEVPMGLGQSEADDKSDPEPRYDLEPESKVDPKTATKPEVALEKPDVVKD